MILEFKSFRRKHKLAVSWGDNINLKYWPRYLTKKIPQLQQEQSVQVTQLHLLRRYVYRHQ